MSVGEALFSFEGRMSRRDYWLKGFLILFPIGMVNNIIFLSAGEHSPVRGPCIILSIASLWPGLALLIKRWHDRDRSAWWLLTLFIPFLGLVALIWILVEVWFLKGTTGPTRFGSDPLQHIEPTRPGNGSMA